MKKRELRQAYIPSLCDELDDYKEAVIRSIIGDIVCTLRESGFFSEPRDEEMIKQWRVDQAWMEGYLNRILKAAQRKEHVRYCLPEILQDKNYGGHHPQTHMLFHKKDIFEKDFEEKYLFYLGVAMLTM